MDLYGFNWNTDKSYYKHMMSSEELIVQVGARAIFCVGRPWCCWWDRGGGGGSPHGLFESYRAVRGKRMHYFTHCEWRSNLLFLQGTKTLSVESGMQGLILHQANQYTSY